MGMPDKDIFNQKYPGSGIRFGIEPLNKGGRRFHGYPDGREGNLNLFLSSQIVNSLVLPFTKPYNFAAR